MHLYGHLERNERREKILQQERNIVRDFFVLSVTHRIFPGNILLKETSIFVLTKEIINSGNGICFEFVLEWENVLIYLCILTGFYSNQFLFNISAISHVV